MPTFKNKHKPFFSVIIPVHNKEPHVQRSIRSVLSQTFQDFELILIDDASTDDSLEEMHKFADSRIRILHRDSPGPGGYAARNLGIKEACAEWVAFLDADDEWKPEHLEKMWQLSEKFPDISFLGCGWQTTESDGQTNTDAYYKANRDKEPHLINVGEYLQLCIQNLKPVNADVACIKKSSIALEGLFPSTNGAKRGGDLHAWLKMICHHGQMAWSNHVGATYFRDSVNMVTKQAPYSPILMSKLFFTEFSQKLSLDDQKLLAKYLNKRLRDAWLGNLFVGGRNFSLMKLLYWRQDFFVSFKLFVISLTPAPILLYYKKTKKADA